MLTIFAIGTLWFWPLIVVESVLLFALLDNEYTGWATLSVIATVLLIQLLGGVRLFASIADDPRTAFAIVAGYLALGVLWASFKWWLFAFIARRTYDKVKHEFLIKHGFDATLVRLRRNIPEDLRTKWVDKMRYFRMVNEDRRKLGNSLGPVPMPGDHKGMIMIWIAYWPFSLLWTFVNDVLRKVLNAAYLAACATYRGIHRAVRMWFEGISKTMFDGVPEDFKVPPPAKPPGGTKPGGDDHGPVTVDGRLKVDPKDKKDGKPPEGRPEDMCCRANPDDDEAFAWDFGGERSRSR